MDGQLVAIDNGEFPRAERQNDVQPNSSAVPVTAFFSYYINDLNSLKNLLCLSLPLFSPRYRKRIITAFRSGPEIKSIPMPLATDEIYRDDAT